MTLYWVAFGWVVFFVAVAFWLSYEIDRAIEVDDDYNPIKKSPKPDEKSIKKYRE